eukprot:11538855-Prorocentrum_lima.AAC.1
MCIRDRLSKLLTVKCPDTGVRQLLVVLLNQGLEAAQAHNSGAMGCFRGWEPAELGHSAPRLLLCGDWRHFPEQAQ